PSASPLFPYTTLFRSLSRLRPSAVGSLTESRVIPPRSLACHFQSCAERCILSAYLSVNYGRLSTLRWMRNLLRQLLRQQVQSTSDRKSTRLNSSHGSI